LEEWHVKVNLNEKRYAIASAVAATAVLSLVLTPGHRIEEVLEVPLVNADAEFVQLAKTKEAIAVLRGVNAYKDVLKVVASKNLRPGRGKMRNRRYRQRLGPLIIHYSPNSSFVRSFRNVPGVQTASVDSLNVLQLAPGRSFGDDSSSGLRVNSRSWTTFMARNKVLCQRPRATMSCLGTG
jgi:large subunit ribosomal protein L4e